MRRNDVACNTKLLWQEQCTNLDTACLGVLSEPPSALSFEHTSINPLVIITTMVLEAGYPNTTGFRKVVKATILVKKKPGMSDEDFIQHYNHKHAQMAAPVLQAHNIVSYSLVGFTRAL